MIYYIILECTVNVLYYYVIMGTHVPGTFSVIYYIKNAVFDTYCRTCF